MVAEENVQISGDATDALVRLSKGDMRRALNVLQACHASSKSRYLVRVDQTNGRASQVLLSISKAHQSPPKKISNVISSPKPRFTNA